MKHNVYLLLILNIRNVPIFKKPLVSPPKNFMYLNNTKTEHIFLPLTLDIMKSYGDSIARDQMSSLQILG